jgi:glycosyltransferase involved in cell wall biosynthesis
MLYYRLLGKNPVFTAHNINTAKRDSKDSWLNRLTLRMQYRLAKHIFVHTEKMKQELSKQFHVPANRISVIPFGINNAVPNTSLTPREARARLGIPQRAKTILFFGRITPYKGLEYLIAAFRKLASKDSDYRLVIAGRPDRCEEYWGAIREDLRDDVASGRVLLRASFIPDEETEVYFKGTDVLVLPYREIYQSGVLFLGHSFGLPVIAADVGSLKDDIVDGKTGFVFRPEDINSLADTLQRFFQSDLYTHLDARRPDIRDFANKRHSWDVVANMTLDVYAALLKLDRDVRASEVQSPTGSHPASSTLRCAHSDVDCAPLDVQ